MLPNEFIILAIVMRMGGGMAYLWSTITGRARPNPISWLLWGVIALIAFGAELAAGVGPVAYVTLALGISPLLVFLAAIARHRRIHIDRLSAICIVIALAGIALWLTTDNPIVAISAAIFADLISGLPTIHKAYRQPHTEYAPTYLISASAMIVALATIDDWTFAAAAFPTYILLINTLIFSLARRQVKPKSRRRTKPSHKL